MSRAYPCPGSAAEGRTASRKGGGPETAEVSDAVVDPDNWVMVETTDAGARGTAKKPSAKSLLRGDLALDELSEWWVVLRKL